MRALEIDVESAGNWPSPSSATPPISTSSGVPSSPPTALAIATEMVSPQSQSNDLTASPSPFISTLVVATPANLDAIPSVVAEHSQRGEDTLSFPLAVATLIDDTAQNASLDIHNPQQYISDSISKPTFSFTCIAAWSQRQRVLALSLVTLLLVGIVSAIAVPNATSVKEEVPDSILKLPLASTKLCPVLNTTQQQSISSKNSTNNSSLCQWMQTGNDLIGPAPGDFFGATVRSGHTANGDRFSVTAPLFDDARGLTRVFDIVGDSSDNDNSPSVQFRQRGQDMIGLFPNDKLEGILSDGGSRLVLSSVDAFHNGQSHIGRVGVSIYQGGNWQAYGSNLIGNSPQDEFGIVSVNRDGTVIAISDIHYYFPRTNAGVVDIFQINEGRWERLGQRLTGTSVNEYWGRKMSLSADGHTVAIGSRDSDNGRGKLQVFRYIVDLQTWTDVGQTLTGLEEGDNVGREVELSADGNILAVTSSAHWTNDAGDTGVGRVRVLKLVAQEWQTIGEIIYEQLAQSDFGYQLRLSDDGMRLAIGQSKYTPSEDLVEAGRLLVFDYNEEISEWIQVGTDIVGHRSCDFVGIGFDLSPDGSRLVGK